MLRNQPFACRALPANRKNVVIFVATFIFEILFIKFYVRKLNKAVGMAMRAFRMPLFLRPVHVISFDFRPPFDCRRGGFHNLPIMPESFRSSFSEFLRIAFSSGRRGKSICFVHEDISNRLTCKVCWAVCSNNRKASAWKCFHGDRVCRVTALLLEDLIPQSRAGVYHWLYTPFGVVLCNFICWLDIEHRSGIVIYCAPHHI